MKTNTSRPVVIHGIDDARIACGLADGTGAAVTLWSARGASAYMGPLWFAEIIALIRAEFPALDITGVLDCGDAPGAAQAALRSGITHLALSAPTATRRKIEQIAAARNARLVPRPGTLLDLGATTDPVEDCRRWFGL